MEHVHIARPAATTLHVVVQETSTVADLRNLDLPSFGPEQVVALRTDEGVLIAVARSLIGSHELGQHRRDTRALKTERVLAY